MKSTKIIVVANQKGGVCKTTTACNVGKALANMGCKVLDIDLDPQANLTISLGREPYEFDSCIVDVMRYPDTITSHIYNVASNFELIPSNLELAGLEMELVQKTARETILKRALKCIDGVYDYILIDCPPQLSILTINALAAADFVVVPCKTDYLSYRGLDLLMHTIEDIKTLVNPDIKLLGIVGTLYDGRYKDHKEVVEVIKENYSLLGITKMAAVATKGIYEGVPVVDYKRKCEISQEYMRLAKIIMDKARGKDGN